MLANLLMNFVLPAAVIICLHLSVLSPSNASQLVSASHLRGVSVCLGKPGHNSLAVTFMLAIAGYPQNRALADRAFGKALPPLLGDRHYARPPQNLFP